MGKDKSRRSKLKNQSKEMRILSEAILKPTDALFSRFFEKYASTYALRAKMPKIGSTEALNSDEE